MLAGQRRRPHQDVYDWAADPGAFNPATDREPQFRGPIVNHTTIAEEGDYLRDLPAPVPSSRVDTAESVFPKGAVTLESSVETPKWWGEPATVIGGALVVIACELPILFVVGLFVITNR